MAYPLKKSEDGRRYTWEDYLGWPDEERWEVIDGIAYDMSPSPTTRHQGIVVNFARILGNKLIDGHCKVFVAPLDVYFDECNFVQPDVLVVCDKKKIKDRIYGAPDLIIEVISPSTSLKDKKNKRALYERFGVKEYVLIHPDEIIVERYLLKDGKFGGSDVFGPNENITFVSLPGNFDVPLSEVFEIPKSDG